MVEREVGTTEVGVHTRVPLQYFTGSRNCVWIRGWIMGLRPQTILFSSKAILFDILSSKTELRTATEQTGEPSKYDHQHCKGYVFWSVPGWHLLLSFGTLQGCRIHKGPPLWEHNK